MRQQLRLSGSGGQGGNVTLHPDDALKCHENFQRYHRV